MLLVHAGALVCWGVAGMAWGLLNFVAARVRVELRRRLRSLLLVVVGGDEAGPPAGGFHALDSVAGVSRASILRSLGDAGTTSGSGSGSGSGRKKKTGAAAMRRLWQ